MEILASIGLMWIIKYGSILNLPREYIKSFSLTAKRLLKCSMCLGFWCGIFFTFISYKINGLSYELIYIPFISSGACWFFDSTLDLIQEASLNISKNKN
tara:strand:+ start:211 stop:507 length:297 start_codon:yes stop_codon:yes gene_type:complete